MNRDITITVELGMFSGWTRSWHTTSSKNVVVSLDDSYDKFNQKIGAAFKGVHHGEPSKPDSGVFDKTTTVEQNGIKNGDILRMHNGAKD